MKKFNLFLKRLIDILGSVFGIIIISPLLLIIAILIKCTSNGPVFFTQERLGKGGMVFKILKFRTMVLNAEKIGPGIFIDSKNDVRITKFGRFLRTTSLDELPQLWNVLIGEMSLVGPRPPVPYHPYKYEDYSDLQKRRFEMKPGITGLTQVTIRNSVPWEDRIILDVEYIENFDILLDIKVLISTLTIIFRRENIYDSFPS